ncbi:substrate-binding periplasmic protein [Aestuariirhabdus sp. LZHN29]|uniref:substrate-binding periplasmic protein n=1 Tax=Aestuariirhabdus sp. LZHN29 TaxID=3417462 RepID=UPI003CEFB4A8
MSRYLPCLLLLCAVGASGMTVAKAAEQDETLIFAYGRHDGPPHAFMREREPRQLYGGILHDVGEAVGERLGIPVRFVEAPRARLVRWLIEGRVHAHCELNPLWVGNNPQLLWSGAVFSSADRFYLNQKRSASVQTHDDLKGLRVGGLKSYTYSDELTQRVSDGEVIRVDAASAQQLMGMLQRGRIDAMLLDEIVADYLLTLEPHALAGSPLEDSRLSRYCAYSPLAPVAIERFSEVIQQLVDEGRIQEIMQRYQ